MDHWQLHFSIWQSLELMQSHGKHLTVSPLRFKSVSKIIQLPCSWSKSCLQDNFQGKDCFAVGSCRPKKINRLVQETEGFNFCEAVLLKHTYLRVCDWNRKLYQDIRKILKNCKFWHQVFIKPFPIPKNDVTGTQARDLRLPIQALTSHQSKESIPAPSKQKCNQRLTK